MKRICLTTIAVMVVTLLALSLSAAATPIASACEDGCCDCTRTPGYWKNHPEQITTVQIGPTKYNRDEILGIMQAPGAGNKLYTMFKALVAAKLNVANGANSDCIADTIAAADAWFYQFGLVGGESSLPASDPAWWKEGEPLYWALDDYNNGLLCAASCD